MLLQHSTRAICNQLLKDITFCKKLIVNNARTFYNDKEVIDFMSKRLKGEHRKIKLIEREKQNPPKRRFGIADTSLAFYSPDAPSRNSFLLNSIEDWMQKRAKRIMKNDQVFIPEKHKVFGNDLAAANFILHRKGKIKVLGNDNWIEQKLDGSYKIPDTRKPDFAVVAIDFTGFPIELEGIDNISALVHLKWLRLAGSETLNDWCIDKLSAEYPNLEYLDISNCINVTERGLEALYRMPNLKTLIVTNHYKSPAFELTCLMLEDVNPYLTCEIKEKEEKVELNTYFPN